MWLGVKALGPGCPDSRPALPLAGWASLGESLHPGASGPPPECGDVSTYLSMWLRRFCGLPWAGPLVSVLWSGDDD